MNQMAAKQDLDLTGLAPTSLICYRPSRYAGDDISLLLSVFSEEDRLTVTTLYQRLKELFEILKTHRDQPEQCLALLQGVIKQQDWPSFTAAWTPKPSLPPPECRQIVRLESVRQASLGF